jgi:hypothetical protein
VRGRKARWWRRLDSGWRGDAGRPAAGSGDARAGRLSTGGSVVRVRVASVRRGQQAAGQPSAGGSAVRVCMASVRRVRRRGQQAAGTGGWRGNAGEAGD